MSTSTPVAVVLGAGMGGRGVSLALAGRAHVVLVDRDETLAETAAQAVVAAGGTAEARTVNLLDFDSVEAFRDDLLHRHGRIDAVVHLVGGWQGSKTVDRKAAEQFAALEPGIFGTLRVTSVVFRDALIDSSAGRFFILSSVQAQSPSAGNAAYASIKAATETWTKALGVSFRDTAGARRDPRGQRAGRRRHPGAQPRQGVPDVHRHQRRRSRGGRCHG